MTARKCIKINHYGYARQCVVIAWSTINVSTRAWTCFFILIHRCLSSTLEEKRFVSRLTPMNTGLPLKNDRAPPVVQRMQPPCVSLYTHEYTTAKYAGVNMCIYSRNPHEIFFGKYYIIRHYWKASVVSTFAVLNKCLSTAWCLVARCYCRYQFCVSVNIDCNCVINFRGYSLAIVFNYPIFLKSQFNRSTKITDMYLDNKYYYIDISFRKIVGVSREKYYEFLSISRGWIVPRPKLIFDILVTQVRPVHAPVVNGTLLSEILSTL